MRLMSVDAARSAMLSHVSPLPGERIALAAALGRVLAEPVRAARDQPPFAASAMDGYALRSAETPGRLRVIGESAAGRGFDGRLGPGEAVRIFTGAAVPADADAVVIQEDVERLEDGICVPAVVSGAHVRPAGGDFQAEAQLLATGMVLDPWRLALCAAAGLAELEVHARPRIAVLSTGEEIVAAPARPGPFQIYDSGRPALEALIRSWGGELAFSAWAGDDLGALVSSLGEAHADLVVTLGGASVGDHDLVRAAAERLGFSPAVQSIAVRPGKPTFFGRLGDGRILLGLPGNPASAMACAQLFLKPVLRAFQGAEPGPELITARLEGGLGANGPREHWMRAELKVVAGELRCRPMRDQDSSLVTVFASAGALVRRAPGAPALAEGELVDVLVLDRA